MAFVVIDALLGKVLMAGVSAALPAVGNAIFKDQCPGLMKDLDTVLAAQEASTERLLSSINSLRLFTATQDSLDTIKDYKTRLDPALERASNGNDEDLRTLKADVRPNVNKHMTILHQNLVGDVERHGAGIGIIAQFMQDQAAKAADVTNYKYNMSSLVQDVETMMKYYMYAQVTGLMLRLAFADDLDVKLKHTQNWLQELDKNLTAQANLAFRSYPQLVQKLHATQKLGSGLVLDRRRRLKIRRQENASQYMGYEAGGFDFVDGTSAAADADVWWQFVDCNAGNVAVVQQSNNKDVFWLTHAASPPEAALRTAQGTAGSGPVVGDHAYCCPVRWKLAPVATGTEAAFRFMIDPEIIAESGWMVAKAYEWLPKLSRPGMLKDTWVVEVCEDVVEKPAPKPPATSGSGQKFVVNRNAW